MEKEKPFFSKDEPFFDEKDKFFDERVRDNLKDLSVALKPDIKTEEPEKSKQEIIQKARHVGYFCPLVEKDERVSRGQKIGFIRIKGLKKEEFIEAEADGVIKEILPAYEITDAEGSEPQKDRTLTSVEYGQALFIIESEKLTPSPSAQPMDK